MNESTWAPIFLCSAHAFCLKQSLQSKSYIKSTPCYNNVIKVVPFMHNFMLLFSVKVSQFFTSITLFTKPSYSVDYYETGSGELLRPCHEHICFVRGKKTYFYIKKWKKFVIVRRPWNLDIWIHFPKSGLQRFNGHKYFGWTSTLYTVTITCFQNNQSLLRNAFVYWIQLTNEICIQHASISCIFRIVCYCYFQL